MHANLKTRLAALPDVAARLRWLRANRLLGPMGLLIERNLVPDDLARVAHSLMQQGDMVGPEQIQEEQRVLRFLVDTSLRFLVLKGARLAYSVYDAPANRWRADLDVLVEHAQLPQSRRALADAGYQPLWDTPGGTPVEQEAWSLKTSAGVWAVDLHHALRNHPLLRDRLSFAEQWQARIEIGGLGEGVFGQSDEHTLLNATMHWFDNLYASPRPLGWLLDMDLLWRGMCVAARARCLALAEERQIAGLLADNLEQCQTLFDTPVERADIEQLKQHSRREPSRRLIELQGRPARLYWHAVLSESGLSMKVKRLCSGLFPSVAHMRARYPESAHLSLARLYARRILGRLRSSYGS